QHVTADQARARAVALFPAGACQHRHPVPARMAHAVLHVELRRIALDEGHVALARQRQVARVHQFRPEAGIAADGRRLDARELAEAIGEQHAVLGQTVLEDADPGQTRDPVAELAAEWLDEVQTSHAATPPRTPERAGARGPAPASCTA